MNQYSKLLSDIVVFSKYAKYEEVLQRRETWEELVARNREMHVTKFPHLQKEIDWAYSYVQDKKILPSMRSLQFAGKPIINNPARIFNCSYAPINHYKAFSEAMFLLLSGVGYGYSVQKHHVYQLPTVKKPLETSRRYLISDDIEGWAESIKILLKSYFFGTETIRFDYTGIRKKGMRLVTSGGKAPGFEPLKECIDKIRDLLDKHLIDCGAECKLSPIKCHDILCHIANAVLAGGIRRSSMISLFDIDDDEMLTCKSGQWWVENEQRGRANNSAVLYRPEVTEEMFRELFSKIKESGCGEPGVFWTNDKELGTNPCFTGDMRIFTKEGWKTFEELYFEQNNLGKDLMFLNSDINLVEGVITKTGFKECIRLYLRNGNSIECTPDHVFMTLSGKNLEAKNLVGETLKSTIVGFKNFAGYVADTDGIVSKLLTVDRIENIGFKDVYDFTLTGNNHWGIVEGVIAHNCGEISLNAYQFCNLCEINASTIEDQEDFNNRAKAASIIGTLQASYTDFHYLRPQWKETTEREALLGIGMTGIASNKIFNLDIEQAAQIAVNTNKDFSKRVGVNQAARVTCVKPSGTSSLVASCSSGIHAWHSKYYIRRMRFNKEESIYKYLVATCPELLEDCKFASTTTAILSLPQCAPDNATTRDESAIELLERVKQVYMQWIQTGHNTGINTHNVSVTVSIRDNEWEQVCDWMYQNRDCYAGISILPYDGGTYIQAPFEEITEEEYLDLVSKIKLADIDLTQVLEHEDNTNFTENSACAGGACEVK